MRLSPILCLSLLILGGCASLSEDECQGTDWYKLGQTDALEGYQANRLQDHVKACQRFDVRTNLTRYQQGRALGLQSYCTAENGFKVGRQGYRYHDICPAGFEDAFLKAYDHGTRLHRIELKLATIRQEQNSLRTEAVQEPHDQERKEEYQDQQRNITQKIQRLSVEERRLERERNQEMLASDRYLTRIASEI